MGVLQYFTCIVPWFVFFLWCGFVTLMVQTVNNHTFTYLMIWEARRFVHGDVRWYYGSEWGGPGFDSQWEMNFSNLSLVWVFQVVPRSEFLGLRPGMMWLYNTLLLCTLCGLHAMYMSSKYCLEFSNHTCLPPTVYKVKLLFLFNKVHSKSCFKQNVSIS